MLRFIKRNRSCEKVLSTSTKVFKKQNSAKYSEQISASPTTFSPQERVEKYKEAVTQAQKLYSEKVYTSSIEKFTEAIFWQPHVHLIHLARAQTFLQMNKPHFALYDIQNAQNLKKESGSQWTADEFVAVASLAAESMMNMQGYNDAISNYNNLLNVIEDEEERKNIQQNIETAKQLQSQKEERIQKTKYLGTIKANSLKEFSDVYLVSPDQMGYFLPRLTKVKYFPNAYKKLCQGRPIEARDTDQFGRGLFATQDFEAGDLIFTETAFLVAHQDPSACAHCSKQIHPSRATAHSCPDCKQEHYCSEACKHQASIKYHKSICGKNTHEFKKLVNSKFSDSSIRMTLAMAPKIIGYTMMNPKYPLNTFDIFDFNLKSLQYCQIGLGPLFGALDVLHQYFELDYNPYFDMRWFVYVHTLLLTNSFSTQAIEEQQNEYQGSALLNLASLINHSCSPNVNVRVVNGDVYQFYASRKIAKDDQLFHSYVNIHDDVETRNLKLLQYGIKQCDCPKCVQERAKQ